VRPVQDLISEAFTARPELAQNQIALENSRISMKGTRSALLPSLDVYANLQNNGLAGQINLMALPSNATPEQIRAYMAAKGTNTYFVGGYGTVLSQVFARNFPNYNAGFQLTVPLRNRAAQADLITDEINYRQQQINDRQLQNNIRVGVINAHTALAQARVAYDTSVKARTLQEQTLAGEQRKYELGSSSFLNVVIVQRDTVTRRSAEVSALNQYIRARTNLQTVTGKVLDEYQVSLEEAQSGQVKRGPDQPPAAK
jgi:outer membrane protein TolC